MGELLVSNIFALILCSDNSETKLLVTNILAPVFVRSLWFLLWEDKKGDRGGRLLRGYLWLR